MKCRECYYYAKCVKESNLKIKRKTCKMAKKEYVMTNSDRVRIMSDEELAKNMSDWQSWGGGLSPQNWLEWLQQPVE